MKKKIFISLFLLIILLANMSFASYSTVTMSVVEEPICTINISENSKFEKKLISKDLNNKEVTIQLQVTNNEVAEKPTGELMLVLDNSNSMINEVSSGKTRKDLIFDSAKSFVSDLLKDNEQLKIGIVSFSSNTDYSKEGALEDATVVSDLTNDSATLTNAISNISTDGPRTDLQAGLKLATEKFSSQSVNKYMIVLTDGVPNLAIDYDKKYYSDDVIQKTSQELKSIEQSGIKLITMLTGIENEDYVPANDVTKTFGEIILEIFGTSAQPTAGQFYYITDDKIQETITNDIYKSLLPEQKSIKDITIIDYFPEEIVKNFDFAYVTQANIGNISTKIDTTTNSITWTIAELANGQTATVQYKLKLKENFDSSIVNKILNTNQKIDISYKDFDGKTQTKTSDISPKLKLTEPVLPKSDTTESPKILPNAGKITLMTLGILLGGFSILSIVKLLILNNKIK